VLADGAAPSSVNCASLFRAQKKDSTGAVLAAAAEKDCGGCDSTHIEANGKCVPRPKTMTPAEEEDAKKAADATKKLADDAAAKKLADDKVAAENARVKAGQEACDKIGKNRKFDATLPVPAVTCPCQLFHGEDAAKKDCVLKEVAAYDATECGAVNRKYDAAAKKCGDCSDNFASDATAPNKMCFPKLTKCEKKGRKLEADLCKCQKGMKPKVDLDYGTDIDCENNAMRAIVSTSAVFAALGAFLYLL